MHINAVPKETRRGWKSLGSGVKGGCKLKEAWLLATEEGQDLEKVNNKRKTLGDVLELGLFLHFLLDSWAP